MLKVTIGFIVLGWLALAYVMYHTPMEPYHDPTVPRTLPCPANYNPPEFTDTE